MNKIDPTTSLTVPDAAFWRASDPLAEILHLMRMSGIFYAVSELSGEWGMDMPPIPDTMMFHFVTEGRCWLSVEGEEPRAIEPGALALVPHGRGHALTSEKDGATVDLFDLPREELGERYELIKIDGDGPTVRLVCGAVHFDDPAARRLVEFLPRLICVDAWDAPQIEWLHSTLRFMGSEARELKPGGETIITRLADVLVIQALRTWIAQAVETGDGWLRAIQDPRIGRAIALVHRDPAQPWSVDSLAEAIGMSRSGFAAHFRDLTGETPMQYVTRWRMSVAVSLLREGDISLAELASQLGYQSEAAFSRAFKRITGTSPGRVRRTADPMDATTIDTKRAH
jgi:AraC-like DNA-binding protein